MLDEKVTVRTHKYVQKRMDFVVDALGGLFPGPHTGLGALSKTRHVLI